MVSEQEQSSECFSGCWCSLVKHCYIHGCLASLYPVTSSFFPHNLHCVLTVYSLQIRLRESQGSCTSGSQGLFCCISADCKWKQNERLSNSSWFILFWCEFGISWSILACTQEVFSVWAMLDFKEYFYLFHLSVISLTSIKVLAAIQESRLASLQIFSQMPVIRIYVGTSSWQTGNC